MGMFDDLIPQQPPQAAPAAQPTPQENPMDSFGRGMGNAMLMGYAPQIGGFVNQMMGGDYQQGVDRSQGAIQQSQEANPNAYSAGNVAGTAADMAVPGGALMRVPGMAMRAVKFGLGMMGPKGKLAANALEYGPSIVKAMKTANQAEDVSPMVSSMRTGGRYSGSPHERVNTLGDALRRNADAKRLSPEEYMKRYGRESNAFRRAQGYKHRANIENDFPENY